MSWLAPARPKAVLRFIACTLPLLAIAPFVTAAEQRPNVLVILSDDVGYSDIGCYGGEIATPNLDKLAAGGVRFTHFYNTGRCCPTRASLLTGLYPHQAGMGWMTGYQGTGGYAGDLNRQCVTLAEVLRPAGYKTYMVGKWHVTPAPNRQQVEEDKINRSNWPLSRGFDRYYGTIQGAGSFFDPGMLVRDEELIAPENPDSFYYTDALSDNASRMIREHDPQKPFLMYLAYTAGHWPLHAKPADMAKYKGKYSGGWDKVREARLARMKAEGLVPENAELAPHVKEWQHEELQDWQAARMEVYAAMIDSMDQGIGRVIETLRNTGQLDNTLILYLQDNGACAEEGRSNQAREMRDKLEPVDPMGKDEIQLASVPEFTRDGKPVLWGRGVMPGSANTYMEVGREWANASNTPFRLFKHYVHEGGIATPLIAHWPRGISRRGELEHQPGHLIDIMPTLVELAGATYPEKFHERDQAITPLEGVSLLPAFASKPLERKDPLFWEHEGNRAIRHGDWKLVARGATGSWQLYNLKEDPSELTDLAEDEPERVAELSAMWGAWASRSGVLPLTPYWPKPEAETQNGGEKTEPAAQPAAAPKVTTTAP